MQIDDVAKADIENAVNAGKEVQVSKTNITYSGWTGCGYIITDPATGSGAYMISGGLSGAILVIVGLILVQIGLMTAEFGPGLASILIGMLYIGVGLCLLDKNDLPLQNALTSMSVIVGGVGLFATVGAAVVLWVVFAAIAYLQNISAKAAKEYCAGG